jgi:alkylation response protein AidB-like acyl-CoA dehydrogenase
MDLNDTPQEAAFRASARAFLQAHAKPSTPGAAPSTTLTDSQVVSKAQAWQACKHDHGWACLTWPEEYGGRGLGPIESVIWNQEEARYDTPPNPFIVGIGMLGPSIMAHGTAEQKARYLPKMARGDEIWCQLFSEPAAGSDLAGVRTSAVRDGDYWIINGQKIWTTCAHISAWGVIVARTDRSVPKHAGLSCFIVNMRAPGVEVRPIRQIDGRSDFNEVFFTDCRVANADRLDAIGNGWAVARTILMHERVAIGGATGGFKAEALLDLAVACGMAEDSGVRQRLADFYVRASGLKYTSYRTLTALSRGQTPGPEGAMGKLVGASLTQEMSSFGVELQGLAGTLMNEPHGCQATYLNSAGLRIAGGTDEILHNIVAERVLGLPTEPRFDKDIPFDKVPTGRRDR